VYESLFSKLIQQKSYKSYSYKAIIKDGLYLQESQGHLRTCLLYLDYALPEELNALDDVLLYNSR